MQILFYHHELVLQAGRGEILEKINLDLSTYKIIVINPGIHVSTGWAFTQLTLPIPVKSIRDIIHQPISTWKNNLKK